MDPRGIRNCNPGNIRIGANWLGMSTVQIDKDFVVFREMRYGIRALYKIIQTYKNKYNLRTLRKIIYRYAPPNENNTEAYINNVAKLTGYEPDEELFFDKECYIKLAKAIIYVENGAKGLDMIPSKDFHDAMDLFT